MYTLKIDDFETLKVVRDVLFRRIACLEREIDLFEDTKYEELYLRSLDERSKLVSVTNWLSFQIIEEKENR